MGNAAVALPVGILAALAVVGFIFVCWWFPRHYRKGVSMDMAEVDEAQRLRELAATAQSRIAESEENGVLGAPDTSRKQPVKKVAYIPPVTPY